MGRGRPNAAQQMRDVEIYARFIVIEAWLTERKERRGLKGWRFIRDADWWQGPPSLLSCVFFWCYPRRNQVSRLLDWQWSA